MVSPDLDPGCRSLLLSSLDLACRLFVFVPHSKFTSDSDRDPGGTSELDLEPQWLSLVSLDLESGSRSNLKHGCRSFLLSNRRFELDSESSCTSIADPSCTSLVPDLDSDCMCSNGESVFRSKVDPNLRFLVMMDLDFEQSNPDGRVFVSSDSDAGFRSNPEHGCTSGLNSDPSSTVCSDPGPDFCLFVPVSACRAGDVDPDSRSSCGAE